MTGAENGSNFESNNIASIIGMKRDESNADIVAPVELPILLDDDDDDDDEDEKEPFLASDM